MKPNITIPRSGQENLTIKDVRGILCNPIYAGIGPYPAMISDKEWIAAAQRLIEDEGTEQFLVNLLYCLRECFE